MPLPRVGIVMLAFSEHRPQHSGMRVGDCDQCLVVAFSLVKLPDPSLQSASIRRLGS